MQLYCYFYLLLLNKILWKQILFMFFQVLLTANIKSLNSYKKNFKSLNFICTDSLFWLKKEVREKNTQFFFFEIENLVLFKN